MVFRQPHDSKDEPLARVLFYSVMLHYVVFFILFGNPFLLMLDDTPEAPALDRRFEIQLFSPSGLSGVQTKSGALDDAALSGKGGVGLGPFPPKVEALGLFPQEVSIDGERDGNPESRDSDGPGDVPVALDENEDPSRLPDFEKKRVSETESDDFVNAAALKREGDALLTDAPIPVVTTRKPPPNMTGPEDCMIKVVGMVCPDGNAQCITAYREFCASLPKTR
ncbi:MAG: hypothetical protein ACE5F7_07675 [Nitrospiria bacterium]